MTRTNKKSAYDLTGRNAIREAFGVSKETVTEWKRKGAPIYRVGGKDNAMIEDLKGWIAGAGKAKG